MTFPRLHAMRAAWAQVPPLALTLHRLALYIGLPKPAPAPSVSAPRRAVGQRAKPTPADAILQAFGAQGMPVLSTRPNDPMLDAAGF